MNEYVEEDLNKKILTSLSEQIAELEKLLKEEKNQLETSGAEVSPIKQQEYELIEKNLQELKKQEEELLAMSKELDTITQEIKDITEKNEQITQDMEEKEKKMAEEINQYKELFDDSLFDEAYMLLEENVNKIDNVIARNKHIRDFFSFIFEEKFFEKIMNEDMIVPVSISFVKNLTEKDFLREMASKLNHFNFIHKDILSLMFVYLVKENEFDKAKFLLNYTSNNIEIYPNTIKDVIVNKNVNALRFLCENMQNIHYNEGSLLRASMGMQPHAIKMLIEEFEFDPNEQEKKTGDNLVSLLIKNKNLKQFNFVVENYSNRINWGAINNRVDKDKTLFEMIDSSGMQVEFYRILLNDLTLKSNYVEKIAQSLFSNPKVIANAVQTDIYDMLFAHPNFDDQSFNLGQMYFTYGLLSKIGSAAAEKNEELAKTYVKILHSFLSNYSSPTIKDASEYHVVGAAVFIASPGHTQATKEAGYSASKAATDAVALILRNFPQYINMPNPNGELPIMQVDQDTPLYTLLVNNGAIPIEPEKPKSFMNTVFGFMRKKEEPKVNEQLLSKAQEASEAQLRQASQATPLTELRAKIRNDLKNMQPLVRDPLCDLSVKLKCENMFLSADKLLMMMEKHNVKDAYEEMNFLSENFATYVQQTLTYYIQVCRATVDLASESKMSEKLKSAKEECLRQVDLLMTQVNQIGENVFRNVEYSAKTDFRVQARFLDQKLKTRTKDLGIDEIVESMGNKSSINVMDNAQEKTEKSNFHLSEEKSVSEDVGRSIDKNDDATKSAAFKNIGTDAQQNESPSNVIQIVPQNEQEMEVGRTSPNKLRM